MQYKVNKVNNLKVKFKIKRGFFWLSKTINIRVRDHFISKYDYKIYSVTDIFKNSYGEILIEASYYDITNPDSMHTTVNMTLLEYCHLQFGYVKDISHTELSSYKYLNVFDEEQKLDDIILKNDYISIRSSSPTNLNNHLAKVVDCDSDIDGSIRLMLWYKALNKAIYIKMRDNGFVTYCDAPEVGKSTISITRDIYDENIV